MRLHKGPRRPRFESNVCTTLPCRGRAKDVLLLPKAVRGGVAAVPRATPVPNLRRGCQPLPAPRRGPPPPHPHPPIAGVPPLHTVTPVSQTPPPLGGAEPAPP